MTREKIHAVLKAGGCLKHETWKRGQYVRLGENETILFCANTYEIPYVELTHPDVFLYPTQWSIHFPPDNVLRPRVRKIEL